MRRYLPLLLIAFFLVVVVLIGSLTQLAGYADKQNPDNIKSITVYTTLPIAQVAVLAQEYEKTLNVQVNVVPLSGEDLLTRIKAESTAPRADIILATSSVLEQVKKAGFFAPYTSEQTDIIPDRFLDSHNYWTGIWYDPIVFVANKDYLKKLTQSPAKWDDLTRDNSMRIGMTDFLAAEASANLLYTMTGVKGEASTLAYFKKLHPQIMQYAKFLATPVRMAGLGEVDVAIAVQSEAIRYLNDNFPVKIIYPDEGTAFLVTGAGLVNGAPHSIEAKLLLDWLTQDAAQAALEKNNLYFIPTNPETRIYKEYAVKNIKLFDAKDTLTDEQKHQLLDKWIQTVRLNTK